MKILILIFFFDIKESKITRGHNYTLVKKQSRLDVRKYSFSHRIINVWNNLSTDCVGETGVHWDTGSIGTPPLIENLQHTEHMRCNFLDAQEPPPPCTGALEQRRLCSTRGWASENNFLTLHRKFKAVYSE